MDCLCSTGKKILKRSFVIQKSQNPQYNKPQSLLHILYAVHVSNQWLYKTFYSKSNWKMGLLCSWLDNSSINKGSKDKDDMQSQLWLKVSQLSNDLPLFCKAKNERKSPVMPLLTLLLNW